MFSPLKHVGHFQRNFTGERSSSSPKQQPQGVGVVKTHKNWGCDRWVGVGVVKTHKNWGCDKGGMFVPLLNSAETPHPLTLGEKTSSEKQTFKKIISFLFFFHPEIIFEKFVFQRMFSPLKHVGHFLRS